MLSPIGSQVKRWRTMRLTSGVIPLTIALLHLQLASVAGFPLTLALPVFVLWVVINLDHERPPTLVPVLASILVLPIVVFFLSPQTSLLEFLRTFALLGLTITALWHIGGKSKCHLRLRPGSEWLFACLTLISGLSVLQFFTGFLGSEALFNLFGSYQYLYEYEPNLEFGVVRAHAFYLEPSYNALVIATLATVLLLRGYRPAITICLTLGGLLSTSSLSGFVWLSIFLLSVVLCRRPLGVARALLPLGALVVASVTFPYVTDRMGSFGDIGSSANFRLIGPVQLIQNTMLTDPLGAPLGSADVAVTSLDLLNGVEVGSSLDNGYYLVLYYFGWAGVLLCAGYIIFGGIAALSLHRTGQMFWAAPIGACLFPVFTGGIMLPEFLLLAAIVWLQIRESSGSIGANHVGGAEIVHRHGVQERPPRAAIHRR